MKHSEETIKAAEQHAMFHIHPDTSGDSFLAGAEHKQKDVDELVEHIERLNQFVKNPLAYQMLASELIYLSNELIQKNAK